MLEKLAQLLYRGSSEEAEEALGERIVVVSAPEFIEPSVTPKEYIRNIWGIIEKDAALTILDDKEIRWLQFRAELIASLPSLLEAELPHPTFRQMISQALREWVDEENAKLLSFLRLKRSWRGFERRLQTIQAPRIAARW